MFPVIQVGPLAIQAAGLFVIVAVYVGVMLSSRRADQAGVKAETLENLIVSGLMGFLAGGRVLFALQHWSSFRASPLDLLSPNPALFDVAGGMGIGALTVLIFGRRKGLALWPTLDALTPFLATLMVGVGLAHLADGSAFGRETTLPWGIELHGAVRHPSQVYEVATALFILWWVGLRRAAGPAGMRFLNFVVWTAGAWLFLEAFRGDSTLILGGIRLEQVVAWAVLALGLAGRGSIIGRKDDGERQEESRR